MIDWNDSVGLDVPLDASLIDDFELVTSPVIISTVKQNLYDPRIALLDGNIFIHGQFNFNGINFIIFMIVCIPKK